MEPPWIPKSKHLDYINIKNPLEILHEEMIDLFEFTQKNSNKKVKDTVIERVSLIIKGMRPNCTILIFGSHVTGLALPNSDVDLSVVGITDDKIDFLRQLQNKILAANIAYTCEFRDKASVPLIK